MAYTITRENPERDLEALKAILDNDGIVEGDVEVLEQIADAIKAQLPEPPVTEPAEFGSVVRAFVCGSNAELWVRVRVGVLSEWANEHGSHVDWHRLCEPEVLRVGLEEMLRPDPKSYSDGLQTGMTVMNSEVHKRLQSLLDEAITSERKNALEKAIQAVEELAP